MAVVWGDQIGLRPFEDPLTEEEIDRIYRWSSDESVLRWSGGAPTELTREEFGSRLRTDHKSESSNRRPFLILTRSGVLIGRVGIFGIDWVQKQGELGIVIGESEYWGKGYGRDTIHTLLRHMFETTSLDSINLFTFEDNFRAQRCFAACGFKPVGTGRRFSPDIGEFDGIEMQVTRSEFLNRSVRNRRRPISVSQEQQ